MSEQKMRVGFIGLGIMGEAMAANVLKAGFCREGTQALFKIIKKLQQEG